MKVRWSGGSPILLGELTKPVNLLAQLLIVIPAVVVIRVRFFYGHHRSGGCSAKIDFSPDLAIEKDLSLTLPGEKDCWVPRLAFLVVHLVEPEPFHSHRP